MSVDCCLLLEAYFIKFYSLKIPKRRRVNKFLAINTNQNQSIFMFRYNKMKLMK